MAEPITFGRRAPQAPRASTAATDLSPEAEAFRAQLVADGPGPGGDFAGWRRSRQGRLALVWGVRLALLAPGLLSMILQLSWPLSLGLELAGFAANGWLQRERRRHRFEILAWTEPEGLGEP